MRKWMVRSCLEDIRNHCQRCNSVAHQAPVFQYYIYKKKKEKIFSRKTETTPVANGLWSTPATMYISLPIVKGPALLSLLFCINVVKICFHLQNLFYAYVYFALTLVNWNTYQDSSYSDLKLPSIQFKLHRHLDNCPSSEICSFRTNRTGCYNW